MRAFPPEVLAKLESDHFICADLYEFDVLGATYRLAGFDIDLTGVSPATVATYQAANIDRERIRASDGLQVDDLAIEIAHDVTTVLGTNSWFHTAPTWVELARGQSLDEAPVRVYRSYIRPADWSVIGCYLRFGGFISSTETGSTTLRIVAVVSADSFGLKFPSVTYEQRCVWDLGGRGCEYSGTGTTYSVTGATGFGTTSRLVLTGSLPGGEGLETFRGGTIVSSGQTRTIVAVSSYRVVGVSVYNFDVSPAFSATLDGASVSLISRAISFTVTPEAGSSSKAMELTTPPATASQFVGGTITSGAVSRTIVSVDTGPPYHFNVSPAFPFTLSGSGVATLAKACDKTAATCDTQFANLSRHMAAPVSPDGRRPGDFTDWLGIGTSSKKHQLYGSRVPVVYGTATVRSAVLTTRWYAPGGQTMLDGATIDDPVVELARVQFGLAFGPVDSIEGVVYEKRLYVGTVTGFPEVDWDYLGGTVTGVPAYPPTFTLGQVTTSTEWSLLSALDADNRVQFGHLAILRCERFACPNSENYPGTGNIIPAELKAVVRGTTGSFRNTAREDLINLLRTANNAPDWEIYDANPADVITDLIENPIYGLGYPAGTVEVDVGADGNAGSSYSNYCRAYGLFIALGIDEDVAVGDLIEQVLKATNSVGFWEGSRFKVVPLGDESATGNSITYTPVLVALEINDDHILRDGSNPVLIRRSPLVDAFNVCPVEWSRDLWNRDVELITSSSMDVADVTVRGPRTADVESLPCIRSEAHALLVSRLLANESIYCRDTYEFTVLPTAAARIQVGDILAFTHEVMKISDFLIRVTETDEDARGQLKVIAKNWNTGALYERISMANPIYDLACYAPDAPGDSAEVARWAISRSVDFPVDFGASNAVAGVAATASTVLTVRKNGSSVGTITFGAAGTVGTFSGAAWSVVADDVVTITNQATADATLAVIAITLTGERPA